MSILSQLASSLNIKSEVPNQELAQQIAASSDKKAVKELVENLVYKDKGIQSDCIKTLYEVGEINPGLIAGYAKDFVALLDSKNNRLQWGAMTALSSIASEDPKTIYAALPKIVTVADSGSVITKDHCVKILVKLCADKKYAADAFELLTEQLLSSPTNQLPMYAEMVLPIINDDNKAAFIKTLSSRLDDIEKDTKRKRMEKVIAKLKK